ncbi:relaxase/mobilization nuclease domain-containing protein [Coprobacter fastidiosus]|uniref:Relaxase/mobilization nuclease-like protein n=1 Tax=Coprobacter fastidiosus NSB1 = JCM 33896 TaxID=1349822 RepID=A0A495WIE1_9BACT|nr:relaxase/mobilization nuclease domain-containing protein [Coprobacter fastidiosus]ERM89070.1 hypothetical protein NSB1T_11815 [Coprobacter fastidiosus NSB1 = JCM 33896]RKT61512.1 relaxase/mobilization nuclease-like protein [Coprobacter fastidiosus NSB1 = JCM 33896]BEG61581.1 relaxase/mobilization nuclease domain-containing protein [Coprobacter fastidiosus]
MIGKITKGGSFKGCVKYVLNKEKAELLAVSGVLMGDATTIAENFEAQQQLNPEIKKPVGHISLSYSLQDADRLTDRGIAQLAQEYMEEMGIGNTQFIIVRHNDTKHPHCHIVYNRIGNDGKVISDKNDFYRNGQVTKKLKEKYGLTFGKGKMQVNRNKLKEPDKTKYQIHRAVSAALVKSKNWDEFIKAVYKQGVKMQPKFKGNTKEIQGISFEKNGYSFKGSEIDRKFSFANLDKLIKQNAETNATRRVPVNYTSSGTLIQQTRYETRYTPPPVENIVQTFSNLLDGFFEPYYSPAPDDSLIRDMEWRVRMKKKKLGKRI